MQVLLTSTAATAVRPFGAAAACRRRCRPAARAVEASAAQRPHATTGRAATAGGASAAGLAGLLACSPAALAAADPAAAQAVFELAALDSKTAGALSAVLRPLLSLGSLLMIVRIVMTWYPELDGTKLPWAIAYAPTEGLLAATRRVVPPFNGLDVSPIVWVALLSFLSEILTGPQGILSLIERKGI